MSALGNDRLLYLHVPKTGGHWVEAALEAAGVEMRPEGKERHAELADFEPSGRFTFAFVREPLSWYVSWWRHCRVVDPTWQERAASYPRTPHFFYVTLPLERYVEACLDHEPGFVSGMYRSFVGPPESPISFVGRYEYLADDLSSALRKAGESFDERALRAVPPLNTSGGQDELPPGLRDRVRRIECEAYERFYPGHVRESVRAVKS